MDRRALLVASSTAISVAAAGCVSRIGSLGGNESSDNREPGYIDRQLGTADPIEIDTTPEEHDYWTEQADDYEYEYIEGDDEFEIRTREFTRRLSFEEHGSDIARTAGDLEVKRILERNGLDEGSKHGIGQIPIDDIDADPADFDTPERGVIVTTGKTYSPDGELLADGEIELEELAAVVPRYADTTIRFEEKPYTATYPILCRYRVAELLG